MTETLGVELSAHQADGQPDDITEREFDKLTEKGCSFLVTRVSRGAGYIDPSAAMFAGWARARGWAVGGYHFMEAEDGTQQAERYLQGPELDFHVLDVEQKGITWAMVLAWVERFRRSGQRLGLYTRDTYWTRHAERPDIFDWHWRADYRTAIGGGPRQLNEWQKPDAQPPARLWQFGPLRFRTEGTEYSIDGNSFGGSVVELLRYTGAL